MAASERIRVLIIDDHEMVVMSIAIALETIGDIEVVGHAYNGFQGVEMVEKLLPDVVLMDILMPGMNGVVATKIIHQKYPQIKIIVLTASTLPSDMKAALEAGADSVLQKETHSIDDILEAIYRAIR